MPMRSAYFAGHKPLLRCGTVHCVKSCPSRISNCPLTLKNLDPGFYLLGAEISWKALGNCEYLVYKDHIYYLLCFLVSVPSHPDYYGSNCRWCVCSKGNAEFRVFLQPMTQAAAQWFSRHIQSVCSPMTGSLYSHRRRIKTLISLISTF